MGKENSAEIISNNFCNVKKKEHTLRHGLITTALKMHNFFLITLHLNIHKCIAE